MHTFLRKTLCMSKKSSNFAALFARRLRYVCVRVLCRMHTRIIDNERYSIHIVQYS